MKVIVHRPEHPPGQSRLKAETARVHAEAILACLERIHCPARQKLAVIRTLMEEKRK